jgi:hypothetical protein
MKVIFYFTKNTPYVQEAAELVKTLRNFNLNYVPYAVESKGSWELNCGLKSNILLNAITSTNEDLLYLDVDARVVKIPPFEELHPLLPGIAWWNNPSKGRELNSSVLYLPNTDSTKDMLIEWNYEQEKTPKEWDQKVLQRIAHKHPHQVLDERWACIDKFIEPNDSTCILQTQASRRLKRCV